MFRQFLLAAILAILLIVSIQKKSIGFSEETIGKRLFFTLPEKDLKPNKDKNLFSSVKNDFFYYVAFVIQKNDSLKKYSRLFLLKYF